MPTLDRLTTVALYDTIRTFRDAVRTHAAALNRLNVYPVPDGDTGTNMARTLDAVVEEMEGAPADELGAVCDAISHGSLMGARGNSGVILSQLLRGFATTTKARAGDGGDGEAFAAALAEASRESYQAVHKPVEGTILTVARESAEAATAAADGGAALVDVVRAARDAGRTSLANTPELLPALKEAGVVDAGGAGFLLLLDAALHVLDGEPLPEPDDDAAAPVAAAGPDRGAEPHADGELDVSEQRYEVMYFLDLADERIDDFKSGWGDIGDSIVVVGGDGLWNCHVHTNDIGAAIETALSLDGRPRRIRVTDLFEEVGEEHARREAELVGAAPAARAGGGLPPVTTAVVAVCSGDGLVDLFAQLGVQGVVTGGQTLNPSTAELLDTVEHVNADEVVILPNNKNIIPVAEQIDGLTAKTVSVVPTRSMPEALAALIVYDPEADVAANAATMREAAASVATGEITRAVRASRTEAGEVVAGDWIGLLRSSRTDAADGIVAIGASMEQASVDLLERLVHDGAELITVITGEDADEPTTAAIQGWLSDHRADVAIEVQRGGQPLYPYLFGVE